MTLKIACEPRRVFSGLFKGLSPKCSTYGEKWVLGEVVGGAGSSCLAGPWFVVVEGDY